MKSSSEEPLYEVFELIYGPIDNTNVLRRPRESAWQSFESVLCADHMVFDLRHPYIEFIPTLLSSVNEHV